MAGAVAGSLPPAVEHVGVDGCPAGWLAAGVGPDGNRDFAVFAEFETLWGLLDQHACGTILVDVPIGLRETSVRLCDEEARDLLGSRWNSVFRTPIREAVELKGDEGDDEDLRPEASDRNDDETGYGLSAQVWNITDDIAELEAFRTDHGLSLDGPVREAHPELAFMAFNGQPVAYSKKNRRGRALREAILDGEGVDTGNVRTTAAGVVDEAHVGWDDVLDAAVLALAADTELATVPRDPDETQPRIYYPKRPPAWDAQSYFWG